MLKKYLLRKSTSSADIFILNNFFAKKVAVPKSNYPKEQFLFSSGGCLVEVSLLKSSCSEKITAAKN